MADSLASLRGDGEPSSEAGLPSMPSSALAVPRPNTPQNPAPEPPTDTRSRAPTLGSSWAFRSAGSISRTPVGDALQSPKSGALAAASQLSKQPSPQPHPVPGGKAMGFLSLVSDPSAPVVASKRAVAPSLASEMFQPSASVCSDQSIGA